MSFNEYHAALLSNRISNMNLSRPRSAGAGSSQNGGDNLNNFDSTLPSRLSPCFLHRRFDDAVNIEKVLEEIAGDESMSHSRLVQTATGVREVSKQLQKRPIKRAVRNVVIITKARDNHLVTLTRELAQWLLSTPRYGSALGVNVYVDAKLRNSKRFGAEDLVKKNPHFDNMLRYWTPELCWSTPEKFDLVCTLGGDGTVLFTSWLFQHIVPPILSFSLGSLGFLTPFDFQNYRDDLNRIMGGLTGGLSRTPNMSFASTREVFAKLDRPTNGGSSPVSSVPGDIIPDAGMRVNLRMRFTCIVHRHTGPVRSSRSTSLSRISTPALSSSSDPTTASSVSSAAVTPTSSAGAEQTTQFEVLNEIVIDRGPSPYVSNLELFGDDSLLTVIQADGCIISTPTGSTAYSLSAGGSLVHPSIPAILLTPICPHTLSFRPMLLNDTISLRVAIPKGSRAGAWCSFDGKGRIELRQGDYVTIRASRYPFATVLGDKGEGWIDSVSRTLRWNTREARQKSWSSARGRGGGGRVGSLSATNGESAIPEGTDEERDEETGEDEDDVEDGDEEFDIDFDDEEASAGPNSGPPSGSVPPLPPPSRKGTGMSELALEDGA